MEKEIVNVVMRVELKHQTTCDLPVSEGVYEDIDTILGPIEAVEYDIEPLLGRATRVKVTENVERHQQKGVAQADLQKKLTSKPSTFHSTSIFAEHPSR